MDYQIACQQQIAENLNRSMVLPPYATDNDLDLTLPTPSAGKAIVWNSSGTNLENSTVEVNALENTLKSYKETAESAASTATTKAGIASDKADIATEKARIATAKAEEAVSTLSTKANKDMDNLSALGKERIVHWASPDYDNPISVNTSPYTATKDGLFAIHNDGANDGTNITINGEEISSFYHWNTQVDIKICAPVSKGDVVTWRTSGNLNKYVRLFPVKGE